MSFIGVMSPCKREREYSWMTILQDRKHRGRIVIQEYSRSRLHGDITYGIRAQVEVLGPTWAERKVKKFHSFPFALISFFFVSLMFQIWKKTNKNCFREEELMGSNPFSILRWRFCSTSTDSLDMTDEMSTFIVWVETQQKGMQEGLRKIDWWIF